MKKHLFRGSLGLGLLLLSLLAAAFFGRSYWLEIARETIADRLREGTGMEVRIEAMGGRIWDRIDLEGVVLRSDRMEGRIGRVRAEYSLTDLLGSPPRLREVRLEEVDLLLIPGEEEGGREEGGPWRPPSLPFRAESVTLSSGRVERDGFLLEGLLFRGALGGEDGRAAVAIDTLGGRVTLRGGAPLPFSLSGKISSGEGDLCACALAGSVGRSRFEQTGTITPGPPLRFEGVLRGDPVVYEEAAFLLTREPPSDSGEVALRIEYGGSVDSIDVTIEAEGRVAIYDVPAFHLEGLVRRHELLLRRWEGEVNGAALKGSGILALGGEGACRIDVEFESLDPARLIRGLGGEAEYSLNGTGRWTGSLAQLSKRRGRFSLALDGGVLRGAPVESALLRGESGEDGVRLQESEVRIAGSRFLLGGRVGLDGSYRGNVVGSIPAIERFRELTPFDSLSGSAAVTLIVEGGRERIRAQGRAVISNATVGALGFSEAAVDGVYERDGERRGGNASARIRGIRAGGADHDSARVDLRLDQSVWRIRDLAFWSDSWTVRGEGEARRDGEREVLVLENVVVRHGDSTFATPERVLFYQEGNEIGIEPVEFSFGGGRIAFQASRAEAWSGSFEVEEADLSLLARWIDLPGELLTGVSARGELTGEGDRPGGSFSFHVRPDSSAGLPLREVTTAFRVEEGRCTIDSFTARGWHEPSWIEISGAVGIPNGTAAPPIDLLVTIQDVPVEELYVLTKRLGPLQGLLSGRIAVAGDWASPSIEAQLQMAKGRYEEYPLGTIRVDSLRFADSSLTFLARLDPLWGRDNRVSGTLPAELSFHNRSFRILPEGPLDLSLYVPDGDFGLLALAAGWIEEGMGRFTLDARVSGDRSDPSMDGFFELRDGLLFFSGSAAFVQNVSARILLDEDYLQIVRLQARSGDRGRLHGWGRVELQSMRPVLYHLGFHASKYDLLLAEGIQLTFDGDLSLGPDTTLFRKVVPHFSGEAEIRGALIERDIGLSSSGEGSFLDPTGDPSVTFNIFLRAPRNLWIRNSTMDIELEGEAQIRRSVDGMGALGEFNVLRGTYWIYHNEFRVTEGKITFNDPDNLRNLDMDVLARTEVMGEAIEMRAYGEEGDIQVEPTSESGYSEGEILSLLTLRARPEEEVDSGELLSSWFTSLAGRLSREVTRGLGDIGTIEIGTSEELPEIRYGNYLSSDLYIGFSQTLGRDSAEPEPEQERRPTREDLPTPERQVRVEYRLRRSLLIQGEAGTLSDGNRFLNLDLRVRIPY